MGLNEQIVQIGAACSDALRYALGMTCSYAIPKLSLLGVLHVILPLLREQANYCSRKTVRDFLIQEEFACQHDQVISLDTKLLVKMRSNSRGWEG